LTGKDNYQAFADSIQTPVEEVPAYLETFEGAAQSACFFWEDRNLNRFADVNDIKSMTKVINGGYLGLEEREKNYHQILSILGS
jgi:putative chitinase